MERTLVLVKPDAVKRALVGRIISRFEDAGIQLVQIRMFSPPDKRVILRHYESNDEWFRNVGQKTISDYQSRNLTIQDVVRDYGTESTIEIGKIIQQRLLDYLGNGDVIAMILAGNAVISKIRRLIGFTIPSQAEPGTIRGDFGNDSAVSAAMERRSMENLVHASDSVETAEKEIRLWFGSDVNSGS